MSFWVISCTINAGFCLDNVTRISGVPAGAFMVFISFRPRGNRMQCGREVDKKNRKAELFNRIIFLFSFIFTLFHLLLFIFSSF